MAVELTAAPEALFWYWITERHNIFMRRQRGEKPPWTADGILQRYKFTNPFRENDRGTVWLRENFLEPHANDDLALLVGNICWYRAFNWWGTGARLGWRTEWDEAAIREDLEVALENKEQVFTGAHIVYSPPGLGKIEAITAVCAELWKLRHAVVDRALSSSRKKSLEAVFDLLKTVHCIGDFQAYEMVTDMRHTRLLDDATDIMLWANMGPGAKRGLQRLRMSTESRGVPSMRLLLSHAPGTGFAPFFDSIAYPDGFWPVFEMRDIEHSLCEFDKYCRVLWGEGEPRSKYSVGGSMGEAEYNRWLYDQRLKWRVA